MNLTSTWWFRWWIRPHIISRWTFCWRHRIFLWVQRFVEVSMMRTTCTIFLPRRCWWDESLTPIRATWQSNVSLTWPQYWTFIIQHHVEVTVAATTITGQWIPIQRIKILAPISFAVLAGIKSHFPHWWRHHVQLKIYTSTHTWKWDKNECLWKSTTSLGFKELMKI